jgi:hypothetical protein
VPGRPPPPAAAVPDISLPPPMLRPSPLGALAVVGLLVIVVLGGLVLLAPANSYLGAYFAGKCKAQPMPPECRRLSRYPAPAPTH